MKYRVVVEIQQTHELIVDADSPENAQGKGLEAVTNRQAERTDIHVTTTDIMSLDRLLYDREQK